MKAVVAVVTLAFVVLVPGSQAGGVLPHPGGSPPLVAAHRGGAGYAPENTLLALRNAVRLGVDAVEVDVMFSADGELVVIHDDTLDRTTDCTGPVSARAVAELRSCDAAHWFTPGVTPTTADPAAEHPLRGHGITIPTLDEVYAEVAVLGDRAPLLLVEVKSIPGESNFDALSDAYADAVLAGAERHGVTGRIIVMSFWPAVLEQTKVRSPDVPTVLLTTTSYGITATMGLTYVIARGHDIVGPNHDAPDLGPELTQLAHAVGKRVFTYTVNTPAEIAAVLDVGPDGIISDFPACVLAAQQRPIPGNVYPGKVAGAARDLGPCGHTGDASDPARR